MLDMGFKMEGDDEAIMLWRGGRKIRFNIKIETKNGALLCADFKQKNEDDTEVNAGAPTEVRLEMSVNQANQKIGRPSEQTTCAMTAKLGWNLTRGSMKPCENCAKRMANQNNIRIIGHIEGSTWKGKDSW